MIRMGEPAFRLANAAARISAGILLAAIGAGAGGCAAQPDCFLHPFAANSPWNTPIGRSALYTPIPDLATYPAALNEYRNGAFIWTTAIWDGRRVSARSKLYVYRGNLWALLNHAGKLTGDDLPAGGVLVETTGNPTAVEQALRNASAPTDPPDKPCNFYSTISPTSYVAPADIEDLKANWTNTIYVPAGASPSCDGDAHLTVMQPSGLMLECYNAIVCANGDVVCAFAGFTDPRGNGTGYENGRTASLIPDYAGKIRQGEITAGEIDHALCMLMPAKLLSAKPPMYVSPAYAFDMSNGYKGTIPMGSLCAIPAGIDLASLNLTARGLIIARAAQKYGIYATDRGGGGLTVLAEANAADAHYPGVDNDISVIVHNLQVVSSAGK